MKIKIIKKCKHYECWYNNYINLVFEVKTNFNNGYGRIFSGDYEVVK